MKDYQKRVIEERDELEKKVKSLETFFECDIFKSIEDAERFRLNRQHKHMVDYLNVLRERILWFGAIDETEGDE